MIIKDLSISESLDNLSISFNLMSSERFRILSGAWRSTRRFHGPHGSGEIRESPRATDRYHWTTQGMFKIAGIMCLDMSGCFHHLKPYVLRCQQTPADGLFQAIPSEDLGKSESRHQAQA